MNKKQLDDFDKRLQKLLSRYEVLIGKENKLLKQDNGVLRRWRNPVLTAEHTPVFWRYDLDKNRNPRLIERLAINSTFNAGAMLWNGKFIVMVRVEGADRKSFFAVAESANGVENFRFWDYPVVMPETRDPDTNVYDMRLTQHADGWIYGLFCTERKDQTRPHDTSAAVAQCGIARTKDLLTWERLPDLISHSGQQRNVVLHPEFVDGKYGLYTRPQDGFIDVGSGGGIGWGLTDSMEHAELHDEVIVDPKEYHTITELKNGQGPAPIKTEQGWLHLAHGVRNTAAGLRYVLYVFLTRIDAPWVITHKPAGFFMAPQGDERVGDVSNVLFSNGWIMDEHRVVYIYYGSSDTRLHVATSTVERLLDYVLHTPSDTLRSAGNVQQRVDMIRQNLEILKGKS